MSKKTITPNQKHLTLEDREYIEEALKRNLCFKEIARYLQKDPTTISKEVRKRKITQKPSGFNNSFNQCKHKRTCQKRDLCGSGKCRFPCHKCKNCNEVCSDFVKNSCLKIIKAPFVCNGCDMKMTCRLEKQYYRAAPSQREYEEALVASREGIDISRDEFKNLDNLISPLVKRGQSIAHICAANADKIPCTERTVYNYFEQNLFSACNLDLPRKVRYKKRNKTKPEPKNYAVRNGRTYEDFLRFAAENPELSIVEMDTVEGVKGGKVLLTMLIRSCRLQLAFLMEEKTQANVQERFEWLYETLGDEVFQAVFGIILTDNGSEFLDPVSLECDADGVIRTHIFFCDPNCSYQKGMLEKNHEYIRYILPKGTSFDELCQDDVRLMLNHINSSSRDSLGGKSPFDAAKFLLPQKFLSALSFEKVQPNEILLKPRLLK